MGPVYFTHIRHVFIRSFVFMYIEIQAEMVKAKSALHATTRSHSFIGLLGARAQSGPFIYKRFEVIRMAEIFTKVIGIDM